MRTYYVVVDIIIMKKLKLNQKKKICPSLIFWHLNLHHNNDQLFSK